MKYLGVDQFGTPGGSSSRDPSVSERPRRTRPVALGRWRAVSVSRTRWTPATSARVPAGDSRVAQCDTRRVGWTRRSTRGVRGGGRSATGRTPCSDQQRGSDCRHFRGSRWLLGGSPVSMRWRLSPTRDSPVSCLTSVPRSGHPTTTPDGDRFGQVTSGTTSPTLDEPVGLASLPVGYAGDERPVRVRIRGEPKNGHTATTPFLS